MSNIYDILSINAGVFRDFPLFANEVVDHQTEKVISSNTRTLKMIEDKMLTDTNIKANPESVENVINKVRYYAHKQAEGNFTSHDLRFVSYYMVKLQGDSVSYDYAITLLDHNWRSMYFNGLVYYLLNSWNMLMSEYRTKVCKLVVDKLSKYNDNNKKYLLLKNHANFFEDNGPLRMSALVKAKDMNLFDAPTIIGYKPSTFSLSYYSDVIINFIKSSGTTNLDTIETILQKHDYDRTKKLVFAYLVGKADRSGDQMMQTNVSKLAARVLGDISLASTWAPFVGATVDDIAKLRKAKDLVNHWFARRLINVFFEVCVQDEDRKGYWLSILEKGWVKDIRIVGSTLIKRKLQIDYRICDMFARYFIETNSRVSQTAAIILCVKNKIMIEFSDTGALYVYNPNRDIISFINKGHKYIDSINDLKIPSIDLLVDKRTSYYYTYYNDEGKHYHRGDWQERLNAWMSEKISNINIESVTFSDGIDEKIFKERPIETEQYTIKEPLPETHEPILHLFGNVDGSSPEKQQIKNIYRPIQTDLFSLVKITVKNENVEYHSFVSPKISSKWFFNDRCRVVANQKNFYIEVKGSQRYAFLKPLGNSESPTGSIWVKRTNLQNYNEIVHTVDGKEITIGYIKQKKGHVIYRATLDADSIKRIKLD